MEAHERSPDDGVRSVELALAEIVTRLDTVILEASDVDTVIFGLHSLAYLLYPERLQPPPGEYAFNDMHKLVSVCRERAQEAFPKDDTVEVIKQVFYGGASFAAVAKLLLFRVAPDWLACFSLPVQSLLFDEFFILAPPKELLMVLVPALTPCYDAVEDDLAIGANSVCTVAERLLVLCLIEKEGLKKMAMESNSFKEVDGATTVMASTRVAHPESTPRIAQMIASIPDKARLKSPPSLHSPIFYQFAMTQLLAAAKDCCDSFVQRKERTNTVSDRTFLLIGDVFSRFCRRGHADIVASQMVPALLEHVKHTSHLGKDGTQSDDQFSSSFKASQSNLDSSFWPMITTSMKDSYAIERLAEALLMEMANKCVEDIHAFWILRVLFSTLITSQPTIKTLFTERFLLWKVFPICCLRWILHFGVFCCPPRPKGSILTSLDAYNKLQKDVLRHLVEVWAEGSFIQSAQIEQQAYLTAAVGLSMQLMTKEVLQSSGSLLQYLLQGVSRRLESPLPLIQQMARKVAFSFSLVIDPSNPLLLDEGDKMEDLCDWEELGSDRLKMVKKKLDVDIANKEFGHLEDTLNKVGVHSEHGHKSNIDAEAKENDKRKRKERKARLAMESYDPDEVIDLGTYAAEMYSEEEMDTDTESESSLQPYDMTDDESDLEKVNLPRQLTDCAAGLRKVDEPDAVERALEVTEKFVRARPDELDNAALDLAHALIHVRCSEVVVEGQEQSAEAKRHCALVALLVCAPQRVVGLLAQELYSAHIDVSQRLLILDVMSDSARELANSSSADIVTNQFKHQLIMEVPGTKWYEPGGNSGPIGAGPWKEVYEPDVMVGWAYKYERELQQRSDQRILGKSRRWGNRSMQLREQQRNQVGGSTRNNRFTTFAASFMLPVMREYDKKRHGVDLLGRDFIVLGRLIYMLGVCMECLTSQPEAPMLGAALLDMLRSRQISNHSEVYVRRSALFSASRIMLALHPSYVASALADGDPEIAKGLDWIREWAIQIAGNDTDNDCSVMAMACVQLHSEMALQASRSMESTPFTAGLGKNLTYKIPGGSIVIPT